MTTHQLKVGFELYLTDRIMDLYAGDIDVTDDLRAGRLIHILPHWEEEASPISFVRPKREPVPKRIAAFSDFLAQLWRNAPWEA
ncbi:hypothetical protein CBW52_13330 [Yersinia kristensenii]|uniref:LysR family transcriptional regulator n=1 Tax=Yersinia kristensenii TaxID=28152 RepID=A0AB73NJG1_YERKR|nr:hypothetical protein CBW52_13330 [Yersinia kristensenii]